MENLELLISSVEADIARKEEDKLTTQTTEAWLLTLRERVEEVEADTEEAFEKRRELVRLIVERINVDRDEDGHTQVQITYRFGPSPRSPRVCTLSSTPCFGITAGDRCNRGGEGSRRLYGFLHPRDRSSS